MDQLNRLLRALAVLSIGALLIFAATSKAAEQKAVAPETVNNCINQDILSVKF